MTWRERFDGARGGETSIGEVDRMLARRAGREGAEVSISEVDRMLARRAGRELSESEIDGGLSAIGAPRLSDFRLVGLCEADARGAAQGLLDGRYLSFEDACLSKTIFDLQRRNRLDESAMREVAKRHAGKTEVTEHADVSKHLAECADCRQKYTGSKS